MDQDNGAFNISDDGLQMMKEQMQNVRFHHNDTHCIRKFALYISSHWVASLHLVCAFQFMVEEVTRLVLNGLTISVSIFLLYALHWLFFVPLNRVRKVLTKIPTYCNISVKVLQFLISKPVSSSSSSSSSSMSSSPEKSMFAAWGRRLAPSARWAYESWAGRPPFCHYCDLTFAIIIIIVTIFIF